MKNKYGLSRKIPKSIEDTILNELGYSCLFCKSPIVEFHHVNPKYFEATEHDVDKIVILCPNHHRMAGANLLTDEDIEIKKRIRKSNPKTIMEIELQRFHAPYTFSLGGIIAYGNNLAIKIDPFIDFTFKLNSDQLPEINLKILDSKHSIILEIENNIIRFIPDDLEFRFTKNRALFKSKISKYAFEIVFAPPKGIFVKNIHVDLDEFKFESYLFKGYIKLSSNSGINLNFADYLIINRGGINYARTDGEIATFEKGTVILPINRKLLKEIEKLEKYDLSSLVETSSRKDYTEYILSFFK